MCWLQIGWFELVTVVRQAEREWFKELDGWVCWWLSGGSELVTVVRQAEGQWEMELVV